MIASFGFGMFIFALFFTHVGFIMRNQTTHEYVKAINGDEELGFVRTEVMRNIKKFCTSR